MSYYDYKRMAQEFLQNSPDPRIQKSAEDLQQVLETVDGRQLAEDVTSQFPGQISRAMEAAQMGDIDAAKKELQKIMSNPKGASLLSKIASLVER